MIPNTKSYSLGHQRVADAWPMKFPCQWATKIKSQRWPWTPEKRKAESNGPQKAAKTTCASITVIYGTFPFYLDNEVKNMTF